MTPDRRFAERFEMPAYATPSEVRLRVSFEFFPPRTTEAEDALWRAVKRLEPMAPRFVSVTYGAGGSTRERTHNTVRRIARETAMTAAAHLTCVGATRAEVEAVARDYWESGIRHIVALRGDPPDGEARYQPHPEGYARAADLVEGLRQIGDFEISVAAYPEVHPDAGSAQADLDNLKRKIDAGASRAISQFFFGIEPFLRFRERARAAGITVPLIPGILPATNVARLKSFAKRCGAHVPSWLSDMFEGLDEDPSTRRLIAGWLAIDQCRRLSEHGVRDFHFYTLNRAELTQGICHALGIRAVREAA